MSKFSTLLVLFAFVASCSSRPTFNNVETVQHEAEGQDEIQVDKGSNSIRINPDNPPDSNTDTQKDAKVKRKYQFDWPVWEARMTRGFLPRGTKRRKRPHKGIDLAASRGTAVMSAHDGSVIYTGKGFKGYGKMVMVESPEGWATLYGHLDKIIVHEGATIKQGEVIGALGNTGRSSGPHLHFEIRKLDGPVDPLPLLPAGEALTNDVDDGSVDE